MLLFLSLISNWHVILDLNVGYSRACCETCPKPIDDVLDTLILYKILAFYCVSIMTINGIFDVRHILFFFTLFQLGKYGAFPIHDLML